MFEDTKSTERKHTLSAQRRLKKRTQNIVQ